MSGTITHRDGGLEVVIAELHDGRGRRVDVPLKRIYLPMGKVEFGGIVKEVCLAYTPEATVGDYVLIHVGFAISRIDESQAREIFSCLEEMNRVIANEETDEREASKGAS